ncbi:MAG TPA: hypothetical protein VHQ65_13450 [Thermoanaerobaculia bacterium]|nr:hypothetical protein [Thermoanaerobaculia bacterium]
MTHATPHSREDARLARLRRLGVDALHAGRMDEARSHFEAALAGARELGDGDLIDRAFCNLSAVEIESGGAESWVPRLREILVRNGDPANCRLAAYHIARAYALRGEHKKGLFYSRIARERSLSLGLPEWIGSSHNQVGNLLLAESRIDEAQEEFELALAAIPDSEEPVRALVLDNLGYCRLLRRNWSEGFRYAVASLRMFRRLDFKLWQSRPHLTLAYGHLEIGRWHHALRHAETALALSEAVGDVTGIKNSLYLLGEAANLAGDADRAYGCFTDLQGRFFPGQSYIPTFLMTVDVRGLINLKSS